MEHWREILGGVVVSAALFFGGMWMAKKEAIVTSQPELVATLTLRINELESKISALQAQVISLTIQNADLLRQQGGDSYSLETGAIFEYIDRLEFPAWCKQVVLNEDKKPSFVMAFLNTAYEKQYGISKAKYIGQTDFENHPTEAANVYYFNDMQVYVKKQFLSTAEPIDSNETGVMENRRFDKFWVKTPVSGVELVCGQEVSYLLPSS